MEKFNSHLLPTDARSRVLLDIFEGVEFTAMASPSGRYSSKGLDLRCIHSSLVVFELTNEFRMNPD